LRIYRSEIITSNQTTEIREYYDILKKKVHQNTRENLEDLLDDVQALNAEEISGHFEEAFFQDGIHSLRMGLMTFTQQEYLRVADKRGKNKNEEIHMKSKRENLDIEERRLRESLNINNWKQKLEDARKTGSHQEIMNIEYEATNALIQKLHEYPYQRLESDGWYQIDDVLNNKEIYCVWFSLIWHAFLSELWIQHQWLTIPWHSALEVTIWDQKYYFDGTSQDKMHKIHYGNKVWKTDEIIFDDGHRDSIKHVISWDPETILMTSMYRHIAKVNTDPWELQKIYDQMLSLSPWNYQVHLDRGLSLTIGENMQDIDRSLQLNPSNAQSYWIKSLNFTSLWMDEAMIAISEWKDDLSDLQKYRDISDLYKFTSNMINWEVSHNEEISDENNKIQGYISNEDYEWLRGYLLDLEKKKGI